MPPLVPYGTYPRQTDSPAVKHGAIPHASYLHAAGGDARESLDHSSDDITRRYYLDTRITGLKPPISFLFNPGGWRDRLLGWVRL